MLKNFYQISFIVLLFFVSCNGIKEKTSEHKYTNALINETSPYLLQHAHNPVDWRPWSQGALDEAKTNNKLVLVSIGYSSCHWCHVMEEETFEDEEVAEMMNKNFISIKVDREERPDLDQVYMTAVQLINGSGGWPLNVIVLPNGKPLYGGTYHTKNQWVKVLTGISKLYNEDPDKANDYADMVAQGIQDANIIEPIKDVGIPSKEGISESVLIWSQNWDLEWGGESGTQKFMLPSNLDFLLDYASLSHDLNVKSHVKNHVKNTLDKMALGGVYDQIGGGFFRYSTDKYWKVPHFEKMLYDNAQLISLYSKAYKVFKEPMYKELVLETLDFLEREMKGQDGGYYAAIDADSEGEEGKYYVWTKDELKGPLDENYRLFTEYYNITSGNSWEKGKFVLYRTQSDLDFAKKNSLSSSQLNELKSQWKDTFLTLRKKRKRPNTDDKIITSWNALMINGFVDAYKAFGDKEFLNRAEAVFDFLREKSYQNKKLVHSYKKGDKRTEGFLEDYAFLANASLNLYGVTMNSKYLEFSMQLNQIVESQFSDTASGMFRFNSSNELISNIIKTDDGVLPSPNAIMGHNLFQLGHINYNLELMDKAKNMSSTMMNISKGAAQSYSKWNSLFLHMAYPYFEISVVGSDAKDLMTTLNKRHIPNGLIVGSNLNSNLPLFKGRFDENETFIFVCQDTTCKLPVSTAEEAIAQIENF
ncbi:thioredoxin domain-containing protein [Flavobacteriaceae bacterium KMM 6897]|nr:thioredoxin domain-containing protein [Flavobacteriaceae bacterium KMM 6897]MEB8347187.1 thioredoxin domain-containing protein [Flavobacteriaceae bacterium KMM 6898]